MLGEHAGRPGRLGQPVQRPRIRRLRRRLHRDREPYPKLERTAPEVIESLTELVRFLGPAIVIGHSLGGGFAIKVTERLPGLVGATVLLAPASVEFRNPAPATGEPGALITISPDVARDRFTNSPKFPMDHFEAYMSGLVAYGPQMRNAAIGVTDDFKIDPDRAAVWRQVPTLMLLAELDRSVPFPSAAATAEAMGITPVLIGRDWNLPDHGHMFIVERESELIANHVIDWLSAVGPRNVALTERENS